MSKTRFSISVDEELAEHIRLAARRAGNDVSTYMWRAALASADRDERVGDIFAEIDENVAGTEGAAVTAPPVPTGEDLSPAEHALVSSRWDSFFGTAAHGAA